MCSIKEVRSGKTTDALKNKEIAGIYPDECAFSIVYGDNFESMDLIANTADEANIWVTGLTCLINTNTRSMTCKYLEDFKGDSPLWPWQPNWKYLTISQRQNYTVSVYLRESLKLR